VLVDTVTGGQKPRRRRGADNAGWPAYVQREFYDYLQCGILAHGFLRLGCDTCHQEMLLPFSCNRSRRHGQPG
jgi:Transposase zinc-binding domain